MFNIFTFLLLLTQGVLVPLSVGANSLTVQPVSKPAYVLTSNTPASRLQPATNVAQVTLSANKLQDAALTVQGSSPVLQGSSPALQGE